MTPHSRRAFLIAAGSTTTGAALVATTPVGAALAHPSSGTGGGASPTAASDPLVVYVSDSTSGRMTVMRGEDEILVEDRDLVSRIAQAVR
jgi:hypothetical protein